ncbi:MAG: single-stranded-DNA-specific exonuclease RecJ [Armatimonadetes bacterium]|nr:single-stranded-DNA-specific exonuclease RecJ [Armatimonadota bacterium]
MVATVPERAVWAVPARDPVAERKLRDELGLLPVVAAVLVARGLTDPAAAEKFLDPTLDQLHPPSLLPDYEAAVRAVLGAKERGETIYVHGDYDVDGVTSAALFTRFLKRVGCTVVPHVPHRMREGYGIHLDAVRWAAEQGCKLFLTCDCGSSAHEQVRAANEAGMTVVVTDHHQIGEDLPEAVAVVNPHRSDSRYPWPELSGVGVALKLCAGLTEELGHKSEAFYRAYLDLAVLGTVADVMPLLGENRVIAFHGLRSLKESNKKGVQALLRISDLTSKPKLTPRHVGFQLGPRINAVGRIEDSSTALDLLLTEDTTEAEDLAKELDRVNELRRAEQLRCVDEAVAMVEGRERPLGNTVFVSDATWHPGVIGLIAGRLVERFRRPAFVLSVQDGVARGSARSIPGFDLGEAVRAMSGIVLGGGGHAMAAGLSVVPDRLTELEEALETYAGAHLRPEDFVRRIQADAELSHDECGPECYEELSRLQPFGTGNPDPVFVCRGVTLSTVVPTSKPEHVRVTMGTDSGIRHAMAFGFGQELSAREPGCKVDAVFSIEENVFNGKSTVRWTLIDVQDSDC